MAIPGTLTHEGPTSVPQASIDTIPDVRAAAQWLAEHADVEGVSREYLWSEDGYEPQGVWFIESVAGVAAELATYGFDLFDQGSSKWYAFLPSDRVAS